jgi:hypothetical protein
VTRREYLQSGHWLVVLGGDESVLRTIADALCAPAFPLYLGRKSCVLSAFTAPLVFAAETAEDAMRDWSRHVGDTGQPCEREFFWEADLPTAVEPLVVHRRNDRRTALSRNSFSSRVEREGHLSL